MDIYKIRHGLKLAYSAFSHYKYRFGLLMIMGFAAGLFGSIGIGAVIPLFAFATGQTITGTDFISQLLEKTFNIFHIPYNLTFLLLFMVFLFIAKALVTFLANYLNSKTSFEYEKNTREELYNGALNTSWHYLLDQKSGYLESMLMDDISNSAQILTQLSGMVLIGTSLITYTAIAIKISTPITLITLGIGGIIFYFLKPLFYKARKLNEKLANEGKATSHLIHESIAGAKTIKAASTENIISRIGAEYFENLKNARIKLSFYQHWIGSLLEPIGFAYIAGIFLFSYQTTAFNIASFAAIIYLVQKMFSFIQSMQGKLHSLNSSIPYLKITLEYKDAIKENKELNGGTEPFRFNDKLEFRNVNFEYQEHSFAIRNINFAVKRGQTIGIVGPSGAGKTTIIDLILRLFRLQKGEILSDNINIYEIDKKAWHDNIGYVSQDIFLLNDTIENNILFYNSSLSHEDIVEASKSANIYDFIETLPDKFKTTVGERGLKLSGGQRQRIALARALARKPQILILDEATSALDNESEQKIQKAIKHLQGKLTILIIAHRLSTVIHSDKIIVLKDGIIQEEGSPQELLNDKGSYFSKNYYIDKDSSKIET